MDNEIKMNLFTIFNRTKTHIQQGKDACLEQLTPTQQMAELMRIPGKDRDESWQQGILSNLSLVTFRCGEPQIVEDVDGFSYINLFLAEPDDNLEGNVLTKMMDDFLLQKGWGVKLNSFTGEFCWILSYGDILNFHLNGDFYFNSGLFSKGVPLKDVPEKENILIGAPSALLIPKVSRSIIKTFLIENGIRSPQICFIMRSNWLGDHLSQDLVFNITPFDVGGDDKFNVLMQKIQWHLPKHYSVVGLDKIAFKDHFMPL
ncbi:hypothetical protein [Mucilaginibacter sp. SP1R1]|uniref:hypothetical protein n=1 Tax=Mucilaginibacter sp. SP1R1 TaxID=2723091 RepID=UPI00160A3C5B|nr:hypothetical protein [Mucilaginibacter sp. SP1R1]MBB6148286.1 hypothetical protein [Mucilaginibacter sp. SP1R1]